MDVVDVDLDHHHQEELDGVNGNQVPFHKHPVREDISICVVIVTDSVPDNPQ